MRRGVVCACVCMVVFRGAWLAGCTALVVGPPSFQACPLPVVMRGTSRPSRCPPHPPPAPLPADAIYGGSRQEVLFRCALLSKAALEAPCGVPCGGRGPVGDSNLLFIANDWHTALVPVYLQVAGGGQRWEMHAGLAAAASAAAARMRGGVRGVPCTRPLPPPNPRPLPHTHRRTTATTATCCTHARCWCCTTWRTRWAVLVLHDFWCCESSINPTASMRPSVRVRGHRRCLRCCCLQGRGPTDDMALLEVPDSYLPLFRWEEDTGTAGVECVCVLVVCRHEGGLRAALADSHRLPVSLPGCARRCPSLSRHHALPPSPATMPSTMPLLPPAPRSLRDPGSGGWMMNVLKAGAITAHRIVAVSNKCAGAVCSLGSGPHIAAASPLTRPCCACCAPSPPLPTPPTHPPAHPTRRYAEELQTPEFGCGLDEVLRRQAWKLTGACGATSHGQGRVARHWAARLRSAPCLPPPLSSATLPAALPLPHLCSFPAARRGQRYRHRRVEPRHGRPPAP